MSYEQTFGFLSILDDVGFSHLTKSHSGSDKYKLEDTTHSIISILTLKVRLLTLLIQPECMFSQHFHQLNTQHPTPLGDAGIETNTFNNIGME